MKLEDYIGANISVRLEIDKMNAAARHVPQIILYPPMRVYTDEPYSGGFLVREVGEA